MTREAVNGKCSSRREDKHNGSSFLTEVVDSKLYHALRGHLDDDGLHAMMPKHDRYSAPPKLEVEIGRRGDRLVR